MRFIMNFIIFIFLTFIKVNLFASVNLMLKNVSDEKIGVFVPGGDVDLTTKQAKDLTTILNPNEKRVVSTNSYIEAWILGKENKKLHIDEKDLKNETLIKLFCAGLDHKSEPISKEKLETIRRQSQILEESRKS